MVCPLPCRWWFHVAFFFGNCVFAKLEKCRREWPAAHLPLGFGLLNGDPLPGRWGHRGRSEDVDLRVRIGQVAMSGPLNSFRDSPYLERTNHRILPAKAPEKEILFPRNCSKLTLGPRTWGHLGSFSPPQNSQVYRSVDGSTSSTEPPERSGILGMILIKKLGGYRML